LEVNAFFVHDDGDHVMRIALGLLDII